ncbi:hypothetical protein JMJ55_28800 [Belnapia sp. T6]|uniref:O-fucosyltransferase family protein n=1 Tax=Belnapia mucosa TaxID=2804532 RepID=A0ABS1VFW8_9PROT|nr:hypothetical protein [Belnapia mucosa]MBL6459323.1 hypothetical protein [Belnapia mucosa]
MLTTSLPLSAAGERPLFIVRRGDRLSARLKSLLLSWRFSNEVGGQLVFCWFPRDRSLYGALPPEPYSAGLVWNLPLFYHERGFSELIFLDDEYRRNDTYQSLNDPIYEEFHKTGFKRENFIGKRLTFLENDHIRHQFEGETEDSIMAQMRQLNDRLPLHPTILSTMARAQEELGDEPYVALHVRRGDILDLFKKALPELESGVTSDVVLKYVRAAAGYTAPLGWYDPHVEEAIKAGERIVFFSDTPETFGHFEEVHGKRKIIRASTLTRSLRTPIQQAMAEFLLIKNAKRIIGTKSSFAGFAARLGDAPVVNVISKGNPKEFEKYFVEEVLQGATLPTEVTGRLLEQLRTR